MDFNSLKDTVSNLTLYDIKAGVRKVQNGRRPPSPEPRLSPDFAFKVLTMAPTSCHELYRDGVQGMPVSMRHTGTIPLRPSPYT